MPPRVLIVTPLSPDAVPAQGSIIGDHLRELGFDVRMVCRGRSGAVRMLDVLVNGLRETPGCDIVLVNVFGGRAFVYEALAIAYGRAFGKRVVAVLRGGWLPELIDHKPRRYARALAMAHARVVPHAFLEAELARRGIAVDAVIPNFIELSQYTWRPRTPGSARLLFMRGFHPMYDPLTVVRAFARVQAEIPEASLTMAGRAGSDLEPCRRLVGELGLRDVSFVGMLPKAQVPALADAHDLYVQANLVENMPVSVIEMWATGVPVVATTIGGTPYLVKDGQDGLLVPPGDPAALAEACLRVLRDPALSSALSEAGRARASELTWSAVGPRWLRILGLQATENAAAAR